MQISIDNKTAKAYADYASRVIAEKPSDKISVFNNPNFGEIRTTTDENGEPWFCLVDVCRALELAQPSRVKDTLRADGVNTIKGIDTLGREQTYNYINEPNLYKCIFQSRKEKAEQFQDWVCGEVLPSIRKTGSYSITGHTPSNPQLQFVQTQVYLAEAISHNLRLNEASRLGMYQSIAEPYHLAIPQYVGSKGVTKALKDLLADMHSPYSAIKFNQMLEAQGYIETKTRPSSGGMVKRFKSITDKGLAYGENLQSPRNQKETQPHWYADKFGELYRVVTT